MNDDHWKTLVKAEKEPRESYTVKDQRENLRSYSCSDSTKPKPHKPHQETTLEFFKSKLLILLS